ncbi:AraC family transcriptional regulator [Sphingomonas sp. H39-1-10]|uniref:helix-turn-helix transcriptional regulator n=1 Tax=Sphingomonas pollutisoli TaxID=3030829 RepID=UPI0023B9CC47|nr:AraC family transcriptional regulator [Sphingomonas pollutisoli]MDF0487742.1 AraC family transcriptional regulator [Sphingomonas pollutisoli]
MSTHPLIGPPNGDCADRCPAGAACTCRLLLLCAGERQPANRAQLATWQVRVAQREMLSQIDRTVVLREIAERLNVSQNHFLKAFKNTVGIPPHRWLLYQRLCLSLRFLADERRSLAEIASECGFSDQSHFHRVFVRNIGVTPGQWRRMQHQPIREDEEDSEIQ